MAKSKDDITYGTAQAKLSEDEALRIRYKAGTPLEGGKIADSEPVDLFAGASNIAAASKSNTAASESLGDGGGGVRKIAESEPVDLFSGARDISPGKK